MKTLAIISPGLGNGGAEKVSSILANYFCKKKYEVIFIAAYSKKKDYYLDSKVKLYYIDTNRTSPFGRLIDRSRKIYKVLKENHVDIVISFIVNEVIFSQRKFPTIFSLRIDPRKYNNSKILRNYAYRRACRIVFQTQEAKNYFSRKIRDKGVVISNPINSENLPFWSSDFCSNTFVTACRIEKQKNLKLMIDGFNIFHKEHNEYSLNIYGDGSLKKELQKYIDTLEASDFIKLCGYNTEINEIMSRSKGFLLTSDYEGMSNSMLEALCIGVPCICTDCPPGGAREYIKNGENGFLIKVGSVNDLVFSLNRICDDKKLQDKFYGYNIKMRRILDKNCICGRWEELINQELIKNG